jgi:hypothetical protein
MCPCNEGERSMEHAEYWNPKEVPRYNI